jgi:predicted dehydrogenase
LTYFEIGISINLLMKDDLRIAIIGAGDRGCAHATQWSKIKGASIVSICDPNEKAALALANQHNAKAFTDYREALIGIDAVSVCTPAFFHPEVCVFAAERGCHILCEKPLALTLEEGDRILKAVEKAKVHFSLFLQRRHMPTVHKLREWIQGDKIGRPMMWTITQIAAIRPKPAMHDRNRGNGGPVVDNCCHYFDQWRFCFGSDPVRATAYGFTLARGASELAHIKELAVDTSAMIVEFASGDIGVCQISWGLPAGFKPSSYETVVGPKGVINPNIKNVELKTLEREESCVDDGSYNFNQRVIDDFVNSIRKSVPSCGNGHDGRIALQTSLALLKSIETKSTVKIDSMKSV